MVFNATFNNISDISLQLQYIPVYKGHSREPENVAFMSSCPLYTGYNYMHYSLMGKMRLSFYRE